MRPEDEASERRVIVPLTIVHYTRFGMLEVELKDDGYKIVGESDQTTLRETLSRGAGLDAGDAGIHPQLGGD